MRALQLLSAISLAVLAANSATALAADGADWTISKSSGEVWRTGTDVQQVALKQEDVLKAGDTIRTGRNGRVLLKRGEETMLVAPNTVVGLPAQNKEGLATTIVQQAGSILLNVEKRNVKHFEVETPYAAAVVKGTEFRVTVESGKTQVAVSRGQVEVANFKSGQIAQVIAGQHATAFAFGKTGISLGGSGTFSPIEQGKPRAPTIDRVPVPRNGFTAPRQAMKDGGIQSSRTSGVHSQKPGRITSAIGDIRLNMQRVTKGLAHDNTASPGSSSRNGSKSDSIGSSSQPGGASDQSSGTSGASNAGSPAAISATIAASSGADGAPKGKGKDDDKGNKGPGNGGANGSGKHGNGKGHGNGNNGNGNNGNGNGNGNGNNGNGNGHGNGRGRS